MRRNLKERLKIVSELFSFILLTYFIVDNIMIDPENDSKRFIESKTSLREVPTINYWQGNSYSRLLNHQQLTKTSDFVSRIEVPL